MRWAKLALPLFVLGITAAGIAALALSPAPQTAAPAKAPLTVVEPEKLAPTLNFANENTTRDVGGGAVPMPVLPDVPLERIAPAFVAKPLGMFGPPVPALGKEEPFLLFQPIVENAGTLVAEGRSITLIGVQPVDVNRKCFNTENQEWACGIKARAQFRALVRGRAISCFLPDQQKADVETECQIGKQNLGQWLVEQGWAEAKPGSELEALGRAAKLMGKGIYAKGP